MHISYSYANGHGGYESGRKTVTSKRNAQQVVQAFLVTGHRELAVDLYTADGECLGCYWQGQWTWDEAVPLI